MFRYNMVPLTNKPTRITKHSANAIDHIITNSVTGNNDLLGHFPMSSQLKPMKIYFKQALFKC